ncbi:hypothetical protein HDA32_000070 [Spinactinospora alkalitolerans]|uniref:Ketoreductase domain-containing protein n=1 Tax=Spinactinospora alkalitolerans TaxID=687207 RepID=A0A852TSJ3_9ACTN|nr:SDR family oxidoreductase [Spinactinospora alkalitolerans]NYE44950.1 hypothetical protein [Spinactinospora alkalitolerans]
MSDQPARTRTALITGASSGIGEEYARQLARRGFALVLVARRAELIDGLAAELSERHGVAVEPLVADLTDDADLATVEERLRVADGGGLTPIDLLVNNAGRGGGGSFARQDTDAIDDTIELNVRALVRLTRAVLPAQIERRKQGTAADHPMGVLNVASMAGLMPAAPGGAIYAATKAFVVSFTESVAAEVRRHGLRVSAVLPGYVRTEMTSELQESGMPGIAFVAKDRVVTDSLRAWAAGAPSVIPGARYKAAGGLLRVVPRGLFRGLAGRRG